MTHEANRFSPTLSQAEFAYLGPPALDPARLRRLESELSQAGHQVKQLSARFVYIGCFEHAAQLHTAKASLETLFCEDGAMGRYTIEPYQGQKEALWVLPRHGTISPWSSKAKDIAKIAGVTGLRSLERGIVYQSSPVRSWFGSPKGVDRLLAVDGLLAKQVHDPMIESCLSELPSVSDWFRPPSVRSNTAIDFIAKGESAIEEANRLLGLALDAEEIRYLAQAYRDLGRNPTEVELLMFAQANSEHCRHKIFNARFTIDGVEQTSSLFGLIRQTHAAHPQGVEIAYADNAAVLTGGGAHYLYPDPSSKVYRLTNTTLHSVLKVETHNHPTAIAPHPGASTGAGGEIRDEGATGRGAMPRFGMTGFSVSQLRVPGFKQSWEDQIGESERLASPLRIMMEGPIGAASFNNEFGRPNLVGYFRSYEQSVLGERRGYRKPIMSAGGVGSIHGDQVHKIPLQQAHLLIQLGGPGFRIGMGGGAASSLAAGSNALALDFDSVQRANPEMQRRAQQVIEACATLGIDNPIVAIHDVGAGGLSNAFPELVHGAGRGADISLDAIPVDEQGMTAAEIWCNESQERYALAIDRSALERFISICKRERCPFAVIGEVTSTGRLRLLNGEAIAQKPDDMATHHTGDVPLNQADKFPLKPAAEESLAVHVDLPLDVLLGKTPQMHRHGQKRPRPEAQFDSTVIDLAGACQEVLRHPSVASKAYLINITDRSVGGLSHRDPMVGPWQVPVADCGIGLRDFSSFEADALAIGERAPIAVWNPAAASRMAIGEAISNLLGTGLQDINQIKLSANWMAACGRPDEDADLYEAVSAASELCQALGIAIPVGKDSLSMRAQIDDGHESLEVRSPVTLVASAWAPVVDIRRCKTPQLEQAAQDTEAGVLILIDLADGKQRMGASIIGECFKQYDSQTPDLDEPERLRALITAIAGLFEEGQIQAIHDRSDGGLWACICEMCFAGHCGASINLDLLTMDANAADWGDFKIRPEQVSVQRHEKTIQALFNEELGLVLQVRPDHRDQVFARLRAHGLSKCSHVIGRVNRLDRISIYRDAKLLYEEERSVLQAIWSEPSYRMASLRDDEDCAREDYERTTRPLAVLTAKAPSYESLAARHANHALAGISSHAPAVLGKVPRVAILREQGVNSHKEMAAAFTRAGFEAIDVSMTDLIEDRFHLNDGPSMVQGIAACGGFSFGDVLGAGSGWAKSILLNPKLKDQFQSFFARSDSFSLGVCNGCQMMSQLKAIIPGAEHWPRFLRNRSNQFEGRLSLVSIEASANPWFEGLEAALLPIVVSHGEGRASFEQASDLQTVSVSLRYALSDGSIASLYPENPNGSPEGIAGVCSSDGRAMIVMPHPERSFLARQLSWSDPSWKDASPGLAMFENIRRFAAGL